MDQIHSGGKSMTQSYKGDIHAENGGGSHLTGSSAYKNPGSVDFQQ